MTYSLLRVTKYKSELQNRDLSTDIVLECSRTASLIAFTGIRRDTAFPVKSVNVNSIFRSITTENKNFATFLDLQSYKKSQPNGSESNDQQIDKIFRIIKNCETHNSKR